MINLLERIWYNFKLQKGLKDFSTTGKTSTSAYSAMRKMFVLTRGRSNDSISEKISKEIPKYKFDNIKGILGDLSDKEITSMVNQMKKDGYYIFNNKLSDGAINEIYSYGLTVPCNYLDTNTNAYSEEKVLFSPKEPKSPRYEFSPDSIVNLPAVQNLLFDQSLLAFAQEYLGTKPILDLIAFWWSLPFNGKGKSAAAQMYHFDMDRIKFIKFFFYLTDVETETGPHCYVKGSHNVLPKELSRDGRFTDEEIANHYGKENLIEICGKKGSIIAVDTRGFHKGKELTKDLRLIFQIEFANSMFGQSYPPSKIKNLNGDIKLIPQTYAYTYNKILVE